MKKRKLSKATYPILGIFVVFIMFLTFSYVAPVSAASSENPKKGGTLRYGINQDYPTLGNPPTQQYSTGAPITDICLESLLILNEKGEPTPWLATSWDYDNEALTLTLTLRKGVKFHDGTDFNAAAAKWNLDQVMAAKRTELASVKSIDIVDDNTIRLNLSRPDGNLLIHLGCVRGLMMSPTAYQKAGNTDEERTAWAEVNPVGTGPFEFVDWQHDVKIVFKKFDGYWQKGKPYLDKVEFIVIENEATLLASFKAGEVDIMLTHQPQNIQTVEKEGKYKLYKGDVRLVGALEGDSKHPDSPWAKKKVRQAAAHSVDNKTFAETIGFGYWVPTNQFDIPGRWGYNPNVKGYPYNPEKAKQLLAEAGYPNGFKTKIYGMPHYKTMLASLQGYLADVGIEAEAVIVTPPKRVEMFSKVGWDGVWLWECNPTPSTCFQMGRNFTAAAAKRRLTSVDIPKEFSDLVEKSITATDFETQKKITWQLQKEMIDNYAFLTFIYGQYMPLPMHKYVQNYAPDHSMHWAPSDIWLDK